MADKPGLLELTNTHGEILLEYSRWLYERNYVDADWYCEADGENTVEDFLVELSRKNKKS